MFKRQKSSGHTNKAIREKSRIINPAHPSARIIEEAVSVIEEGDVVLFPTRCLYGLAADALNPRAVERIFRIKRRSFQNPLLVLVKDHKDIGRLAQHVSPEAKSIMNSFWPGKITLVFKALPVILSALTAGTGKIGVRIPGHPVASRLVHLANGPITGTSANISGSLGASRISDIDPVIISEVDLILDAGPLKGGSGSTVVDMSEETPKILRRGEIPLKKLFTALNHR